MKFDLKLLNQYTKTTTVCCEKHPDEELYLYGYYSDHITPLATVWDDVSIYCRGLILDRNGEIVERPFPKFWTYQQYLSQDTLLLSENRIVRLPQGHFRILEKVDGTMTTLYWIKNRPYLATQRSFTNVKAVEATKILHEKYSHLFKKLNRSYTYIFEAVYPETKVLIDYEDKRDLFLIGVIDKQSGETLSLPNIGFPTCKDYTEEYGHITNLDELVQLNLPNQEGFVLYFENGLMVKLKFPWYKEAHKIVDFYLHKDKVSFFKHRELLGILGKSPKMISNLDVWKKLKQGDYNLYSIRQSIPDFYYLMGFDYWLTDTKQSILNRRTENWDSCKPEKIEYFNIDARMNTPHVYETSIWKWEERYIKF